MKTRVAPSVIAGFLFLLAAVFAGGVWCVFLFAAMPTDRSVVDSVMSLLQYTFSSANPGRWWFTWLASLPILCGALGAAYLLNVAHTRKGGLILLCVSIVVAIGSFAFNDWVLAMFVALPILWGYRALHAT
jgi:hypothetical protein